MKVERPKALSPASLATYRADTYQRLVSDPLSQGLYLTIGPRPRGTKSWLMRIRRPNGHMGKVILGRLDTTDRELKVGEVPKIGQPLTLLGARSLAADIHRQRANGVDVVANHKAQRRRDRTAAVDRAGNTFAAAVKDFIDEQQDKRSWRETAKFLGLRYPRDDDGGKPTVIADGLCELWMHKTLREIDVPLVHDVIVEARKVGMPGLKPWKAKSENRARLLFVALSSLFSWLQSERRVDANPCANVPTPKPAIKRERWLNEDEVRIFWAACDELGAPFGSIFKLCLLTGARLNEITRMTRAELSTDGTTWSLSGQRTKNKREHVVPLSALAQSIIADVPRIEGPYVFTFDGKKPARGGSRLKDRLDKIIERVAGHPIEPFRIHDLRRTAVTHMAELGIAPHVIEQVINHVSGARASVAGIYNRSQLLPERKAALERWATHVEGLVSGRPANVVPLKGRNRG